MLKKEVKGAQFYRRLSDHRSHARQSANGVFPKTGWTWWMALIRQFDLLQFATICLHSPDRSENVRVVRHILRQPMAFL